MERVHVRFRRQFHFVPEIDVEEAIAHEDCESGIDIPRARSKCRRRIRGHRDNRAPNQLSA